MNDRCEFFIKRFGRRCKKKKKIEGLCNIHYRLSPKIIPIQNTPDIDKFSIDDETCTVCTENIKEKLDCSHFIHKLCIIKSGKNECPLCRKQVKLTTEEMKECEKYSKELRNYIEEIDVDDFYMEMNENLQILIEFMNDSELVGYIFEDLLNYSSEDTDDE